MWFQSHSNADLGQNALNSFRNFLRVFDLDKSRVCIRRLRSRVRFSLLSKKLIARAHMHRKSIVFLCLVDVIELGFFWYSHGFTFISNNCPNGDGEFRTKNTDYLFPTLQQYGSVTLMTFTQSWKQSTVYRVLPPVS